MVVIRTILVLVGAFSVSGCFTLLDSGDDSSSGDSAEVAARLNAWLAAQYPNATPAGSGASGVSFTTSPGSIPVFSNQTISGSVPVGGSSTVTEVCMGFGAATNAVCVPVSTPGASAGQGTASLDLTMPPELCADISQTCHDIKCYEFAKTSAGTFTAGNISSLVAACGACDEPSCQSLVDECVIGDFCLVDDDCTGGDEVCLVGQCVGSGALRFSLSWGSDADFDLYVQTPTGSVISYQNRSADTGTLDVDDVSGGSGSVENVFFTAPPAGTYTYWVNQFGSTGGSWSLNVFAGRSTIGSQSGALSTSGGDSAHFTITP